MASKKRRKRSRLTPYSPSKDRDDMDRLGAVFPSMFTCLGHMPSVATRQTDPSFTTICSLEVLVRVDDGFNLLLPRCACLLIGKMTHGSCSLYHREV